MDRQATYIVTGCTGYVGNVLTKRLLELDCRVVGLVRDPEKFRRVFPAGGPEVVYGDVRDMDSLRPLFAAEGAKIVIHTAAYVSIGEGDSQELLDVTVGGTENMLALAAEYGVQKFLHISSSEALPHGLKLQPDMKNYIPTPEKARKGYNRAKALADVAVLKAVREQGLNASLVLLAGVLGPGDYSNTHMTQVIIDYINGKLPASVDGGYNDFDIRDVADVLESIIDNAQKGESYIFANKPDKINEVLAYVAAYTGSKKIPTLPIWIAYVGRPFLFLWAKLTGKRPLYTSAALASLRADTDFPLDKSREQFGYAPRPLEETVRDHVAFLAENGMVKL